jgi:hypothetical protein
MDKKKERLQRRNLAVRKEFDLLATKNPQFKIEALISLVADKFFLSERTITAILNGEGCYN